MIITRRGFLKLSGAALLAIALPDRSAAAALPIPVLMYHHIGAPSQEFETVAPAQFAAQMEWLYGEGYRAISVAELATLQSREGDKVVLITADDGHASFLDHAFYLLREYGFKATMNIVGRSVGDYVNENHPRLSWDEMPIPHAKRTDRDRMSLVRSPWAARTLIDGRRHRWGSPSR